jgi:hypothetical protein
LIARLREDHIGDPVCGSLCDFHESILDKLRCPCHGIRVDLDARKQVGVPPVVDFCGCPAEFNLHAAVLKVSDEILVRITRRYVAVGIVGAIVQRHVTSVRVKDGYDLGLGIPIGNVIFDELKVENRSRKITFKLQRADTEHQVVRQLNRYVDLKQLFRNSHVVSPFNAKIPYPTLSNSSPSVIRGGKIRQRIASIVSSVDNTA